MSGLERRLARIEAALSPQAAVLAWMIEAHAHGSLLAYVDTLRGAPDDAFPLIHLPDQVEKAIRATMRGQPRDVVWREVRLAVRDTGFLYYLVSNLNWRLVEHKRANWLHVALATTMLRAAAATDSEREFTLGWAQAEAAAHTAYIQQGTVAAIAQRYFGGTSPLFPDVAADVTMLVSETERVIGIFNDLFSIPEPPPTRRTRKRRGVPPVLPPPLDLAQLRAEAAPAIEAEVSLLVDMAKAEALTLIGERDQSFPLVARHVWPESG